ANAEVEHGTVIVRLGAGLAGTAAPKAAAADLPDGVDVLRAETDGTLYLSSEPGKPAFAPVGTRIDAKATIALIEVMKTFTPVKAPSALTIERVLVTSGASVAQGQVLFWVRK